MRKSGCCLIPGCDGREHARGWCNRHYRRWLAHGDPNTVVQLKNVHMPWLLEIAVPYAGNDCLIWPFTRDGEGYGSVKYGGRSHKAGRVVCEKAHGAPPTRRHEAAHSCGNGHLGCVNPRHIRWATAKENQRDKVAHGTSNRGERHNHVKLSEADVRTIRALARTLKQQEIADRFGVHQATISYLLSGRNWGWLEGHK